MIQTEIDTEDICKKKVYTICKMFVYVQFL
jgi:hypothetical protein